MRKKILLGLVLIMGLSILGGCHESIEGKTDELKQEGMIVTSETEEEKVITPISSEDVYGHYICEEPGFGGMFTIDISSALLRCLYESKGFVHANSLLD